MLIVPKAHRFLYAAPRPHPDRAIHTESVRDSVANHELEAALIERGFGFGRSVLNFPPNERRFDLLPFERLFKVELPFVQPEDILVQTTRPPLSEAIQNDRKKVEPSNSTLERATFLHWWRYFRGISRSSVRLRSSVARFLGDDFKDRQFMTFHQVGCLYKSLGAAGCEPTPESEIPPRTAAFLLRVDSIVDGGPGYIAAWGLNAEATLAWNRMLRHRYSHLLDNRGLTVVELETTEKPERFSTYDYMDDWSARVLLETGGEGPPRPEEKGFDLSI